ncbi:MAG: hypothetical protein PHH58_10385 [Rhodoferax sp.]|nr:hypothetical protein [Rhodoferax sp.]
MKPATGKGFIQNIEALASSNTRFRQVLYTGKHTQLVLMALYSLHSPPNHREGVVYATRADAIADDEHFDDKATE